MFSKDPNLCASNFNEELLACVGPERLVETFRHFSRSSQNKNNGAAAATICKKFYRGDGLHPNQTGSQLLGALISRSVCRALECERSRTSASPPRTVRSKKDVTVENVCSGLPVIPPPALPPRMIFIDAHAPPPPMDDIYHFPALPTNEVKAGNGYRRKNLTELAGYSKAVKCQAKPKKTDGDLTQLKTLLPPKKKKDCKLIIDFLNSFMHYQKRFTEKIFFT